MRNATRNVGGMPHPGNLYHSPAVQDAAWASLVRTQPDIITAQEVTGFGRPFQPPKGWRAKPFHPLDRIGGSVVAIADGVEADLEWRPSHPVLDAFGAYLDFALVRACGTELAVVSVHVPTWWYAEHWAACGLEGNMPSSQRPWTCDVILDSLIEVLHGRDAILAGDWNEALTYPADNDPDAAAFFGRAKATGYVEVVNKTFGGPVRTNFTRVAKRSYQNDHVFMAATVAERVEQVAIFNEPTPGCSDHAGIVVTVRD